MSHSIKASQLNVNSYVYVRGNVEFSRLTRFLTDKELESDKLKRQARGMIPIDTNYLTITISDAKILPINPAQLSLEEQYIQETFYKSQKNPNVNTYSPVSKSNNFPKFFEPIVKSDGSYDMTHCKELPISNEPAAGMDVTIVMRSFKPKKFNNVGFVIDSIIANGPMQYYDFSSAAQDLKKRGITVDELTPAEREAALARLNNRVAHTPASADDSVMTQTQPAITPPAAGSDPYSTISNNQNIMNQPVTNAAPVQPAANSMPAQSVNNTAPVNNYNPNNIVTPNAAQPTDTWTCPTCNTAGNTGRFCAQCATPKPEANAVTGIVYDPNSTNRNY